MEVTRGVKAALVLAAVMALSACGAAEGGIPLTPAIPSASAGTTPPVNHDGVALPNPSLTPGEVDPAATLDVVCHTSTSGRRNVPLPVKEAVYRAYGLDPRVNSQSAAQAYEVDHLIPLELGGDNSMKNLWPQPAAGSKGFHDKDRLENRLHVIVCKEGFSLQDAQSAIAKDWYAAYVKFCGDNGDRCPAYKGNASG